MDEKQIWYVYVMMLRRSQVSSRWCYAILGACTGLTFLRNPALIYSPRIWAEEGSIYLQDALSRPFWNSFISQHSGYYSFANKLVALVSAHLIPLHLAAHATTMAAALLQLATAFAIYSSVGILVRPGLAGFLVALSPFFLSTHEIWLNTTNIHFWLGTGAFFIIFSRSIGRLCSLYLLMAFLTGIPALLFFPFFLLRIVIGSLKIRPMVFPVFAGSLGLVIQASALISYMQLGNQNDRFNFANLGNMIGGFKEIIIPFSIRHGLGGIYLLTGIFAVLVARNFLISKDDKKDFSLALAAALFYSFVAVVGSLGMAGGSRYGLPVYCFGFSVFLVSASQPIKNFTCLLYLLFCFVLASAKLSAFVDYTDHLSNRGYYSSGWQKWSEQVKRREGCEKTDVIIFPQWQGSDWRVLVPRGKGLPCRQDKV